VDLPGATLLPGLVDTHVHLAFDASTDPVGTLVGQDDDELLAAMVGAAHAQLRAGVTTVRDLGDRGDLALKLRDGAVPGPLPTILAAGPPITTPGGHSHFLGGGAAGVDGVRAAGAGSRPASTPTSWPPGRPARRPRGAAPPARGVRRR
jgi:imidazolonepropionase-like amidohydrolase